MDPLVGRFNAPKCSRDGCKRRTKRHRGGRAKPQIGADGKRYRMYCGNVCSATASYRWTEERSAAARAASRLSQAAQTKKNIHKMIEEVLKPFVSAGVVTAPAKDLAKIIYQWGNRRSRDGFMRGMRAERSQIANGIVA